MKDTVNLTEENLNPMKNENSDPGIVILGGGLAGLGAAYQLTQSGFPCTLFESEDRLGGFATSFHFKDCVFDYGPHAFHAPDRTILDFYLAYMGEDVLHLKKHVEIKFRSKFYDYPIQPINLLKNLSAQVIVQCGLSYIFQTFRRIFPPRNPDGSLEELFIELYGKKLYNLFFEKYTEKVWGFHPRNLSMMFLKYRLPSFTLFQMAINSLKDLVGHGIKGELSTESFVKMQYYPRHGAGTFPDKLAQDIRSKGGIIKLNSEVQKIYMENQKVRGISYKKDGELHHKDCDICISTIPLTHFIRFMDPPAAGEIAHSAEQLYFRAIIIYCIVVRQDAVIHCDALYFHDRIFHRMGQMNSYSEDTSPPGKSAITVEVACFMGDPLWNMDEKELLEWILKDLSEEGFDIKNDVEGYFVLRKEYGYPAPTLGYEKHLATVFKYLNSIPNLYSGGRQGLFTYIQMFHALQMGFEIAQNIISGNDKPIFEFDGSGKRLAGKDPYFV